MPRKRTLILVANEKTARLFFNEGIGKGLVQCASLADEDFDDSDQSFDDRAGRGSAPFGTGRHAIDPRQTEREQERVAFAAHVVAATEKEWAKGYDRLAIAAAPRMLGELRDALPAAMMAHLAVDLDKDLARVPLQDLPDHFADHIVF